MNGRPTDRESRIEPLAASGGMDRDVRIAHAKTMVIDGAITLMGSMNWTNDAAANSEDLNLSRHQRSRRPTPRTGGSRPVRFAKRARGMLTMWGERVCS